MTVEAEHVEPEILVETVDRDGHPIGSLEKLAAHTKPGTLHRAFSLFAFDSDDRLVLQQRSADKYHSPLLWTNTACGHPFPGETPADAVRRRAHDELGVELADLVEVGTVYYQVDDHTSGLVEHEFNHVFTARIESDPVPAPHEVADVQFVDAEALAQLRTETPLTAWFDDVYGAIAPTLAENYPGFGVTRP